MTTWYCEYERIHLSMGQPDFCSYFYLLLQCFPKCWPQVMLKAIGVAFRSVMFALLLLLGLVYVFAIAALLHLGMPTLGAIVLVFRQGNKNSNEGSALAVLYFASVSLTCQTKFFTQTLDGKDTPGRVGYESFRTVSASCSQPATSSINSKLNPPFVLSCRGNMCDCGMAIWGAGLRFQ